MSNSNFFLTQGLAGAVRLGAQPIRRIDSAAYTLQADDANTVLVFTSDKPVKVGVEPYWTANLPLGCSVELIQQGRGSLTLAAGSNVELFAFKDLVETAGVNAALVLRKIAANQFHIRSCT